MSRDPLRRALLVAASAAPLMLGACSSGPSPAWLQLAALAGHRLLHRGPDPLPRMPATSSPLIGLQIGGGARRVLTLSEAQGGRRTWTSASHIAVTTENGRILATAGLPSNVSATVFRASDPLAGLAQGRRLAGTKSERMMDFRDRSLFSVPVTCTFRPRGRAAIQIPGQIIATLRFDEDCRSPSIGWSFTNSYWVGARGIVWKSVQTVSPDGETISVELLRPPSG